MYETQTESKTELAKIISAIEAGKSNIVREFTSAHDAVLFSYSLYNERRKKNIGRDLKISVDKIRATVTVSKKIDPTFKLF